MFRCTVGVSRFLLCLFIVSSPATLSVTCRGDVRVADGVRAVVTRATGPMAIDGDLREFESAVCTPLEYFHPDRASRPAQFFYLWDEQAFYVGLRTLDTSTFSPVTPLWEGDAVEWYFDTRRDKRFRDQEWGKGSVHCFWTAMEETELNPRFCLRPGYLDAIPATGVDVAARRWEHGLEVEFRLPWINFPDFTPAPGEVIGIDAELSYSDGGPRSDRSFVFGSPLSVIQPGNLARVQLVDRFEVAHWKYAAAVMMPMRVDTSWGQRSVPKVQGRIAVPPGRNDGIGRIVFHLIDLLGQPLGEFEATDEQILQEAGDFRMRVAEWPADLASPGQYNVVAIIHDTQGRELARVSPRLVSVNMRQGY